MKKLFWVVLSTLALIGAIMLTSFASFGSPPTNEDLSQLEKSPQYDIANKRFDNSEPGVLETLEAVSKDWKGILKFFSPGGERSPSEPMPQGVPDMTAFNQSNGNAQLIWFGHSSLLMRMAEKNILIDPMFSKNASPIPFTVARYQAPVLDLTQLPEIDYIVISHDHYDHLDMKTVQYFSDKQTQFIVPIGIGSYLRGWGIPADRITELDWWQTAQRKNIEFVCTPARHFSGRSFAKKNPTLWASWVIKDTKQTIYYSGDSGYAGHFKEIGEKYGPFDLAILENGQYNNRWRAVHLMPEEAAQAYFDLKAEMLIPIHWAMFELSMHTWYQPGMEIAAQAKELGINLVTPKIGETVLIDGTPQGSPWWQQWVDPKRPAEWYAEKIN
ncbi:MAG: MBL fold metallo-hydrolase [Pseudodesulfovibrio sp.]